MRCIIIGLPKCNPTKRHVMDIKKWQAQVESMKLSENLPEFWALLRQWVITLLKYIVYITVLVLITSFFITQSTILTHSSSMCDLYFEMRNAHSTSKEPYLLSLTHDHCCLLFFIFMGHRGPYLSYLLFTNATAYATLYKQL